MYNFGEFITESRFDYVEVFEYFYNILITFLEKRTKDQYTYEIWYENKNGYRIYYQTFEEMMYILNKGKEYDLSDKPKIYKDIMYKSAFGIKFTDKASNKGSFLKMKTRLGLKYLILVSEHIDKGGPALKKFDKEKGTTQYFYNKFIDPLVKKTLFHEFTHLIDKIRIEEKGLDSGRIGYKNSDYDKININGKLKTDMSIYYNSTPEFNARVNAAFYMVKNGTYNSYNDFKLAFMDHLSDKFKSNLTEFNKKRLLKVIYSAFLKIK